MGVKLRVFRIIALFLCSVGLLAGCAGGGSQRLGQLTPDAVVDAGVTIEVLDEAVAVPAGVEPQLMRELAAALKEAVSTNEGSSHYPPSDWFDVKVDASGAEPVLRWEYILPGDYDLNGAVNAQDITPIALGFGLSSSQPDYAEYLMLDGDGNGEINVADITLIGRNYGAKFVRADFNICYVNDEGYLEYLADLDVEVPETPDWRHPWQFTLPCPPEYVDRQFLGYLDDVVLGPPEPLFLRATYGTYPDHIELRWVNSPFAPAGHYVIYRDDPSEPYEVFNGEFPYIDYGTEYGKEHMYWVQSASWIFKSKLSEPAVGMALDWQSYDVDNSARAGFYPSACIVDGRLAVSYVNPRWSELWYASELNEAPQNEGDWQLHEATDIKDQIGVISYLASFKGLPCIGYTSDVNTWHSRLAVAKSNNPDSQESWEHTDISVPGQRTALADLAVINGKLAACYIHYPLEDVRYRRLIYARALTDWPQGSTDWNATVVTAGYGAGIAPHLASYQGQPVMIYHEEISESKFRMMYAYAQTSEPAGEEDWLKSEVDTIGYDFYQTDLEFVEDCPAVFFLDGYDEQDAYIWQYTYAKASSSSPQGPEDWHRISLGLPYHAYETTDLGIVGGKPAAVFTSYNKVQLAWASIPNPQYSRDWSIADISDLAVVGDPLLYYQFSLTEIDDLPVVAYRDDRGESGSSLRFISPVWP